MKDSDFTVIEAAWPDYKSSLYTLRSEVFIHEQRIPKEIEWDEYDETSFHVLTLDTHHQAVGTGRLLITGQIGRMAVLKEFRRRGIGTAILTKLLEIAEAKDMNELNLIAQLQVIAFYRRHGFTERGAPFKKAGIPHIEMVLKKRNP